MTSFVGLWRSLQSRAFEIGIHIEEFWDLTLAEFMDCVKGYENRRKEQVKDADLLNFIFGSYIMRGLSGSYPSQPATRIGSDATPPNVFTDDKSRLQHVRRLYGKKT